jgi:hypothetical protein
MNPIVQFRLRQEGGARPLEKSEDLRTHEITEVIRQEISDGSKVALITIILRRLSK